MHIYDALDVYAYLAYTVSFLSFPLGFGGSRTTQGASTQLNSVSADLRKARERCGFVTAALRCTSEFSLSVSLPLFLTHSLTYSLIDSFTHSPTCSLSS